MRYLFAVVCSPVAILLCDRAAQAALNTVMWILTFGLLHVGFVWVGLIPVLHAFFVVQRFESDQRLERMVQALQRAPISRE